MITVTFEAGNTNVRIVRIVTDSTLAQVITAGWYSNTAPNQLNPSDEVEIAYAQGTNAAATAFFSVSITAGVVTLSVAESGVVLPVVAGDFAVFSGTSGAIADLGYSPTNPALAKVVMASGTTANNALAVFADTVGTLKPASTTATLGFSLNVTGTVTGSTGLVATTGNVTATAGNLVGGNAAGGNNAIMQLFPTTAATGSVRWIAAANGGNFNVDFTNASFGQATVITAPDPGSATAKFVLDTGTNASGTFTTLTATTANITNLKYGATPVPQVDPASCTITAAAGAANTATITVQLKDGSGTNMARIIPFRVYSSSTADGLTLQSAASTGYSVASGGLSLQNGAAITTQISCMSSATGGCVLSLLDTGKQTSYLVLVLANGCKISAQLSAGSYG